MVDDRVVDQLELGDHVCWVVDDDRDRRRLVGGFVGKGLRAGHRVVVFTDRTSPADAMAALEGAGVPVASALHAGQLRLESSQDAYYAAGHFESDLMLRTWRSEISAARREGWAGMRVVGDMGWAARAVPGADRLLVYESEVNNIFIEGFAAGLCLYDRQLFSDRDLTELASAHLGTGGPVVGEAWQPLLRVRRTGDPYGLLMDGEADVSNRRAVAAVLSAVIEELRVGGPGVTLDLSRLSFADAHTAWLIAQARSAGADIFGCSSVLERVVDVVSEGSDKHTVREYAS